MTTELALVQAEEQAKLMEKVVVGGDLEALTATERLIYYRDLCESLGLNWRTRPFEYLRLNDKLTLYARRDATDQLRGKRGISVQIISREVVEGIYIVTARASEENGRSDESIGAVALVKPEGEWKTSENGKRYFKATGNTVGLTPDERANAVMKAETKAKRRVTLSLIGLGWLDETEIETVADARKVPVTEAGEIVESTPQKPPLTQGEADQMIERADLLARIATERVRAMVSEQQLNAVAKRQVLVARYDEAPMSYLEEVLERLRVKAEEIAARRAGEDGAD